MCFLLLLFFTVRQLCPTLFYFTFYFIFFCRFLFICFSCPFFCSSTKMKFRSCFIDVFYYSSFFSFFWVECSQRVPPIYGGEKQRRTRLLHVVEAGVLFRRVPGTIAARTSAANTFFSVHTGRSRTHDRSPVITHQDLRELSSDGYEGSARKSCGLHLGSL